ncbi:MAG: porin family protein [Ignavibacteria bacterium]
MKKVYLILLVSISVIFISDISQAQQYRVNLYSAYTFDDDIEAVTNTNSYFNGTIVGGYQWGVGFEYILKRTYGIELAYFRQSTDVDINYSVNSSVPDSAKKSSFGAGLNYIMLGGNKYLPIPNSPFAPFGGLMIGLAIFDNQNPVPGAETSTTKFAWAGRVGTNIMFSPNVGLRIHGQLMSAVQSVGGGLYLGTGGVGAGVDTESSMYQFGLGGALVIQFGSSPKPKIPKIRK